MKRLAFLVLLSLVALAVLSGCKTDATPAPTASAASPTPASFT